ncbi:MAG TPA: DUF58 domain-containing protein [Pirellulales bacterium]|jgi:uncharacterized protein (DUF58 family)|nr:DUF58 domain-containing protein [Pirellulales bacterium]
MSESATFLKPEVLARIVPLGLRAQRVVEGTMSGLHRSPLHGVSVEFADYREYVPGDDLKRLDWRAYARSNRYYIKRYEEETNFRATLLVDASASMRYGRGAARSAQPAQPAAGFTKFSYAATLAASLAMLCLKQRDAVGLALFDESERSWLRPSAAQSQLLKILDVLESAQPDRTTDLGSVLNKVAAQINARGLVILVSDLLCDLDALYHGLGRLQRQGHDILIFHVLDKEEIELPFNDSVLFRDIEGSEEIFAEPWAFRQAYRRAMDDFILDVGNRCRSAGIDYTLLTTSDDLAHGLAQYLHRRQTVAGRRIGKITAPAHDQPHPHEHVAPLSPPLDSVSHSPLSPPRESASRSPLSPPRESASRSPLSPPRERGRG